MVAPEQLLAWQEAVRALHVSDAVRDYILDLLDKSRQIDGAGTGLSPRAGLALQRCAQAWAFAAGRDMVVPEDVQAVAPNVIAHRLGSASGRRGGHGPVADGKNHPGGAGAMKREKHPPAAHRALAHLRAGAGLHVAGGGQLLEQSRLCDSLSRRRR